MQQRILTMPVTLAEVHCCRIPCNITAPQFCSKSPQATATESSITHWISDTYVKSRLVRGPNPIIQANPNTHGGLRSYYHCLVLGHRLSCRRTADRRKVRPCIANHLSKRAQAAFREGSNWYIPWRTRCNQNNIKKSQKHQNQWLTHFHHVKEELDITSFTISFLYRSA